MRGRKPKPSYLRVLDGQASHGAKPNPDEPKPEGKLDDLPVPDDLSQAQAKVWRDALRNAPPGLLRKLDDGIFKQWVIHAERFSDAAQKVSKLGSMLKTKDGVPYQNPYLAVMNKQSALMMKAAAELGFTPSSRSRVKVDPKTKRPGGDGTFADLRELDD